MVLCNYFLNGNCRFGSKCANDHIDIKTIAKTEVESAINGKQWLLSCFGPFKESVVLPNFIEDRSFEEVRLGFLESSKSGSIQQHVNELNAQYNDALNKLNHLKMATPDMIQLLASIYNNQSVSEPAVSATPPPSNNFPSSSAASQQNPFQMGSVFAASQQQQSTMSTGNIFGASMSQPQQTPMSAGSIFGGTNTSNPFQASNQASIFGGAKDQPSQHNASFSFPQPQGQQSIFGSSAQQTTSQNIFGASQPVQQPPQPTQSIFGGQSSSFSPGSMFAAQAPQQQPVSSGSIFGQSTFSQSLPTQPTSSSMFEQSQSVQSGAGIFGQSQQPAQTTAGVFGQPQQPQPATNIFGAFLTPQQHQPSQSSPFAQSNLNSNVFGTQTIPNQPAPPSSGSVFQIQQSNTQQSQPFGANPFQTQPPPVDESVYSKPDDLTPEELQEFQAEAFTLGKIPLKPPPKHFCF